MAVLNPTPAILDETDSGLDVDALRIVGDGVTGVAPTGALYAGNYPLSEALDHIVPDHACYVLAHGRIVKSGTKELALELEQNGYAEFASEAA